MNQIRPKQTTIDRIGLNIFKKGCKCSGPLHTHSQQGSSKQSQLASQARPGSNQAGPKFTLFQSTPTPKQKIPAHQRKSPYPTQIPKTQRTKQQNRKNLPPSATSPAPLSIFRSDLFSHFSLFLSKWLLFLNTSFNHTTNPNNNINNTINNNNNNPNPSGN